ncbi:MAG: M23 family metallopeptidase, partial [Patescibacteria group bacterium]
MYTFNTKILQYAQQAYLKLISIGYRRLLRPFSRFFRKLFEAKRIKRVYGVAMLSVMLSSAIPRPLGLWKNGGITSAQAQYFQAEALITERSVRLPLNEYVVTQEYSFFHQGIDLASTAGNPIYPVMDGTVIMAVRGRTGFGN